VRLAVDAMRGNGERAVARVSMWFFLRAKMELPRHFPGRRNWKSLYTLSPDNDEQRHDKPEPATAFPREKQR
jgi:hypothetical protein